MHTKTQISTVPQENWYAVYTLPRSEIRARINLERQGFRCFCPFVIKTSRKGHRLVTQSPPLFPSYIFIELELDKPGTGWRSVDSTYGVRRLVKHGDRPSPLPGAFMRSLIEMTNESGIFSYSSRVATGDRVQFLSGPFAGMIGTLEALDTHGRITILLTLLGQSTRVRAKVNDIVPASTM